MHDNTVEERRLSNLPCSVEAPSEAEGEVEWATQSGKIARASAPVFIKAENNEK
jgi:hypothetical protein